MLRLTSLFMLAVGALATVNARNVTSISDCPALTARTGATSVCDLRIDDIKVIGFLGDSFAAAFAAMGTNSSASSSDSSDEFTTVKEYRGISYGIGGDDGALTVANYIKHYQSNLTGPSLGSHATELCTKDSCTASYIPEQDVFNSAQSGAMAMHLEHMLDYLIPEMKSVEGANFENDWKLINIQIGGNDMCSSCNSSADVTADLFGGYVESAIETIRANVPKVLVNLIGSYNTSQIIPLSDEQGIGYCTMTNNDVSTIENRQLCQCGATAEGRANMVGHYNAYNSKLQSIYKHYKKNQTDDFAVVYQQSNINISSFPIEAFSNIDCLHPSLKGHQWLSRFVWNQLFLDQASKPRIINYEDNLALYCPVDSDRIVIE